MRRSLPSFFPGLVIAGAAVVAAASAAACGVSSPSPARSLSDEIVGGVGAKSAHLDAIGALGRVNGNGSFDYYCTATLVAPRLVLTAKHCAGRAGSPPYTETETIHFGIGEDSRAPKRTVKVLRTWTTGLAEGGYVERGSDVAIMVLDETVDDVAPLSIASGHVDPSAVGKRVSAVGYGLRDVNRTSGQRRAGTLTVHATNGPLVQGRFATADELLAFVIAEGGAAYDPVADEPRVREPLGQIAPRGSRFFAGVAPGDAQPCSGDSGGPLVGRVDGGLVVLAVVSGSFKLTRRDANPCSVVGEIYATFPPDVQAMLDEASAAAGSDPPKRIETSALVAGSSAEVPVASEGGDRCAGVSVTGYCDNGSALRCIAENEGPRRVTRTDCTLLLQTCGLVAGADAGDVDAGDVAACIDP